MPEPRHHVGAATLARQTGLSSRWFTEQAARGKIPGAYQPGGRRGAWRFVGCSGREGEQRMATIYQRGQVWWGRVQRQGRELRQSLKTTSERIAQQRLKAWLDELERVAWGERPRRTFDDLALDQINGGRLVDFENQRRRGGRRIPEKARGHRRPMPISAPTIRRDLACLSSMFSFAIELEWCDANPVGPYLRRGRHRGLRESAPRRRYLTEAEEAALLAAAGDKFGSQDLVDAIALAIDTGLRQGELFGLTRAQVDLAKNEIRIEGSGSKNSRPRAVPLLPRSRTILGTKPAQLRSLFVMVNMATGRRYRHLNRGLAGAARRAKIAPLIWHDLRRTCGCRLLQLHGLSMAQVSRWLGHSSIVTTERAYAFLEDEHLQQAIASRHKPGTGAADSIEKA